MSKKFLSLLFSAAIIFCAVSARCEVIDKIAIVVNNEIITQGEIDKMLAPVYAQYRTRYQGEELLVKLEEARQKIIAQLIEDKLILSEAKRLNIEADEKAIEARLDDARRRFGSREKFDEALAEEHITVGVLRERYREQMVSRSLIDQKIGSRIVVTPVEVSEYYNAHPDEFVQEEQVKLRNILVKPKKDIDIKKTVELINMIHARLLEGSDFSSLAKIYSEGPNASEGGLMGFVGKGELLPEIEEVVFNLKEGEISGIIQTSLGYHIFKVEEKRERKVLPLKEVYKEAEEIIFRDKIRESIKDWVESLKKNAYIAFK